MPRHPVTGCWRSRLLAGILAARRPSPLTGCFREAIECDPGHAPAHSNLGFVLARQGKVAEAIACYRKALQINPRDAEVCCKLGLALGQQGKFADSVLALQRGHELGSAQPGWANPSGLWLARARELKALDSRPSAFLGGKGEPGSAAERLALAWLCQQPCKQRYATAVRLYARAFSEQPKAAEDLEVGHRYNAACAAAGPGTEAGKRDETERTRLRRQALDWLRADLQAWRRLLDGEPDQARCGARVTKVLQHWRRDADFAGLREPPALGQLPEAERQPWQKLWDDIADTLARAQPKAPPEKIDAR